MAAQTSATVQNENMHIPRGKGKEGVKADLLKPEERKERKALADLSNLSNLSKPTKPGGFTALKGSTLKEKSSVRGSETTKKAPKAKSGTVTDEEIKKWAKEGIEKVHFTVTDIQKHERDAIEKRVKKKVDMIMSSMSIWNRALYDYVMPMKKIAADIEDIKRLEPEPEVLLPVASLSPTSGFDEGDPVLEEPETLWPSYEHRFELKLKEEYEGDAPF